jgi:hypothetical protein
MGLAGGRGRALNDDEAKDHSESRSASLREETPQLDYLQNVGPPPPGGLPLSQGSGDRNQIPPPGERVGEGSFSTLLAVGRALASMTMLSKSCISPSQDLVWAHEAHTLEC